MLRKLPSWVPAYAVVAAVFAGLFAAGSLRDQPAPNTSLTAVAAPQDAAATQDMGGHIVWSHGHDGTARNAQEHWLKHGRDFPEFHDAAEYERGALAFLRHPPTGTLVKRRFNGDTLLYDPATNTFAVEDEDGEPRTFFRPDSGRSYWERQ